MLVSLAKLNLRLLNVPLKRVNCTRKFFRDTIKSDEKAADSLATQKTRVPKKDLLTLSRSRVETKLASKDSVGWGGGIVLHSVYQMIWVNVVCAALYYKNIAEHDPNVLHALKIGQYNS